MESSRHRYFGLRSEMTGPQCLWGRSSLFKTQNFPAAQLFGRRGDLSLTRVNLTCVRRPADAKSVKNDENDQTEHCFIQVSFVTEGKCHDVLLLFAQQCFFMLNTKRTKVCLCRSREYFSSHGDVGRKCSWQLQSHRI